MDRRNFVYGTVVSGTLLAFGGFAKRALAAGSKKELSRLTAQGYGPLAPTASRNTGERLIALPKGFEYNVLGRTGSKMSDGNLTPAEHDGMAAFSLDGKIRIVRNHEISDDVPKPGVSIGKGPLYDPAAGGGTTTLVIDPKKLEIERDFVSLGGTLNNCAGGKTPWGSWISCEETTLGATVFEETDDDGTVERVGGFAKPHGYCFEVPALADGMVDPVPIKPMGRFSHEAVAFDQIRQIVYMTEDADPESGFYRYLPKKFDRLTDGGRLQMLAVKDRPNIDLRHKRLESTSFEANWVDIEDPDPRSADTDELAVYKQGQANGAARFEKLEGCFADRLGNIYFVDSSGGENNGGRVWLYRPQVRDGGRLSLIFETPDRKLVDMPDNICLPPTGNLLFMCEDSDYADVGGTTANYVRILTSSGKVADFVQNIHPGHEESELAGATFSPDGRVFFVNIQEPGVTLAIWGDWKSFREN